MKARTVRGNVVSLTGVLPLAERGRYAIGSFSPRYTAMIAPVLRAGQSMLSPLIVQVSQKELLRYHVTPAEFSEEFYGKIESEQITVPVVLHLDHTKDLDVIVQAIEAGFTSVMIDASEQVLAENIRRTREVVELAHAVGVSVEAELGKIGTTDFIETDNDEELYTDPFEAARFVTETQVDALAVSIGTAHGVYAVRQPSIDYDRLQSIRSQTSVHLVLHGGSGIHVELMQKAIASGVSKVNIATDLEVALLAALGRQERMTNLECTELAADQLTLGRDAVRAMVEGKIANFLGSGGMALGKEAVG